jgi:hypothetical protein
LYYTHGFGSERAQRAFFSIENWFWYPCWRPFGSSIRQNNVLERTMTFSLKKFARMTFTSIWKKCLPGKCTPEKSGLMFSGQMSFGEKSSGQMSSGQIFSGKFSSGQMYLWANVLSANVMSIFCHLKFVITFERKRIS